MKIDQSKLTRQQLVIRRWAENKFRGTLEAATGFGKTYVGILAIKYVAERIPEADFLVIVPTTVLKDQWEQQVTEHKLTTVTVMVINTAIKLPRRAYLTIIDEFHRVAALTFYKLFSVLKYELILGLTPIIEREDERHHLILTHAPIIDTISLTECEQNKWVCPYVVYNLGIDLPDTDKEQFERLNSTFNKLFAYFGHDFKFAMKCVVDPNKCTEYAGVTGDTPSDVQRRASVWRATMQKRRTYLQNSPQKAEMARKIIEQITPKDSKVLVFFQTIVASEQFAKSLEQGVCAAYHSGLTKKAKAEVLNRLTDNRTKLRVLASPIALEEGFDMPQIDYIIVVSGTSVKRQNIQRMGRGLRFVEGKVAAIINIYLRNTQDARWLKQRQQGVTNIMNITDYRLIKATNHERKQQRLKLDFG